SIGTTRTSKLLWKSVSPCDPGRTYARSGRLRRSRENARRGKVRGRGRHLAHIGGLARRRGFLPAPRHSRLPAETCHTHGPPADDPKRSLTRAERCRKSAPCDPTHTPRIALQTERIVGGR